ncbi:methyltransferase domain-containing protein [Flavobacterium bizetiae]|uniref:methyltransferase domain-containing protein n=1 Tax=Flavobacterium bizetiae TaxID=2704140 RepID=UPI0021E9607E|nr:methyltransferase domain-containing protein [Flavobacterium bizetiae]UTN03205.1 methyltransferase domain-containing protein [Flavobacterium bizetiae]
MAIDTTYRTQETEIMDDFFLEGKELQEALDKIASINRLLGGNKLTLHGLKTLLKKSDATKTITIADIGCGNGDMLRMLANYGKKNNLNLTLIGIDANAFTINYARKLSTEYPNIEYVCVDIFSEDFNAIEYDIVLCTLTLHHFSNEEILNIMTTFNKNANIGIVINDLHRSKLAYRLFEKICAVFKLNKMSREDGLISILRGFKKKELENFSKKLDLKNYTINWKWAFRYQWIIAKK